MVTRERLPCSTLSFHTSDAQFKELRVLLLPLVRGFADFDNHIKTLRPWAWSLPELPLLNRPSMPSLPRLRRLQHWNRTSTLLQKMSTLSLHAYARLKRMQRSSPVVPTRQDRGTYLDTVTAPQPLGPLGPLGPVAQGHLMTAEIQGLDLILSLFPKMNKHEVPSYYGSRANKTTKGLRSGSIIFWKNPICQRTISLSDFIAKQVLRRAGLYLKTQLTVLSAAPKQLSMSANPNPLKTERLEKQFAPLWRELADQHKILFPDGDDEGAFIIPALDTRSQVLSIKDRRNVLGKHVFKLASLGSGQTFTDVTPELSVPGISLEVLQRVLSQASTANA